MSLPKIEAKQVADSIRSTGVVNERLARIEDVQMDQARELASSAAKLDFLTDTLKEVKDSVDKLSGNTDKSNLYQKVLMGGILLQAILHGVVSPEVAKQVVASVFGGK